MKSTVWISSDLGIRGDFSSLYAWLDKHQGKECGDSLAVLNYEYTGDLRTKLSKELSKLVADNKRARIYVIYRDSATDKNKGAFLVGHRKGAPWEGYGPQPSGATDEEL